MILLEGPDRCGKSTLAKVLLDHLPGWSYRHHTKPPIDPYSYFSQFMADTHPRVVVDRHHWSGYAYGNAYHGTKELEDHSWRMIELAHLSRCTSVILLTDDPENIRSRWSTSEMYSPEHLEALVGHYDDLFDGTSSPVSYLPRVRFTLPDLVQDGKPTEKLQELIFAADSNAIYAEKLLPASLGVGKFLPKFVVLGEAPGPGRISRPSLMPSMPFDQGPTADLLWHAFDAIGLQWWEGYYTNASAFLSSIHFAHYVNHALQSAQTILCLGSEAFKMAARGAKEGLYRDQAVVWKVDHPAYVRRFWQNRTDEWINQIHEVLEEFCEPTAEEMRRAA